MDRTVLFRVRVRSCLRAFLFLQLLSYGEMLASATNICSTLKDIPCIGDGDTGYGNALNVKHTVKGYAQVLAENSQKISRTFRRKFAESSLTPFHLAPRFGEIYYWELE